MGEYNAKLCILAAGRGARMGSFTDNVSKALLPINNKAAISIILEQFPVDLPVVIAVGYKSESLIEYLKAAHYDRQFTFVHVDNFDGPGSGPGLSMSMCRPHLQQPFYLSTIDTIVTNPVPDLTYNWLGVAEIINPLQYSTVQFSSEGDVTAFRNKAADGYKQAYIGLCGVRDWEVFWANFDEYAATRTDKEMENVGVFYKFDKFPSLKAVKCEWFDTGCKESYLYARDKLTKESPYGLKKNLAEITYFVNNRVVKYFEDVHRCHGRLARAKNLGDLIPPFTYKGNNIFAYEFVNGANLYEMNDPKLCEESWEWLYEKCWKNQQCVSDCFEFYHDKTIKRVEEFIAKRGHHYEKPLVINNLKCDGIWELLEKLDWGQIRYSDMVNGSGDCNNSNILWGNDRFYLIDWRETFIEQNHFIDAYYDISKVYAGLCVSWHVMQKNLFSFSMNIAKDEQKNHISQVNIWYEQPDTLCKLVGKFEKWVNKYGFDLLKMKIVAALSYINMAPLHSDNSMMGDFLFAIGAYKLQEIVNERIKSEAATSAI